MVPISFLSEVVQKSEHSEVPFQLIGLVLLYNLRPNHTKKIRIRFNLPYIMGYDLKKDRSHFRQNNKLDGLSCKLANVGNRENHIARLSRTKDFYFGKIVHNHSTFP